MGSSIPLFDLGETSVKKSIAESKNGLSSKQLKAIKWYSDSNDLRLQLCNPPMQMNFVERSTDEPLTVTLETILDEYNEWNENDKKARARERKLEKERQENIAKGFVR